MIKIVAFVNQKGGTGKTTACINIAAALALKEYKILLLDLDGQANTTISLGVNPLELKKSMYDVLLNHIELEAIVQQSHRENLWLAPANIELANTDISLEGHQTRLKEIVQLYKKRFDFLLIDCPPSLSLLTVNALSASDSVIIPMLCDYLSLEGLKQLLLSIEKVKNRFNHNLTILGILPNKVDQRRNLTHETLKLIRKEFPKEVFKTEIPVCAALAEAPSFGRDIFGYTSWSTGAAAYEEVTAEILRRITR
jgi:chromosome partitioning protein